MRFFKWLKKESKNIPHHPTPPNQGYFHTKVQENWHKTMDSTQKNMSRGAQNIFRIVKCRCHWGNKQLWGYRDKGRGKFGHRQPK
jgi:hypothetical protein